MVAPAYRVLRVPAVCVGRGERARVQVAVQPTGPVGAVWTQDQAGAGRQTPDTQQQEGMIVTMLTHRTGRVAKEAKGGGERELSPAL